MVFLKKSGIYMQQVNCKYCKYCSQLCFWWFIGQQMDDDLSSLQALVMSHIQLHMTGSKCEHVCSPALCMTSDPLPPPSVAAES